MSEEKKLVPKLRFPEFLAAAAWIEKSGDSLFDQISDRNPEPGLPVLAITQEHGAIPRHMIDYHVSVTEKSIESYKVVQVGDFIISLRSFQGGIEYSNYQGICSPAYVVLRRRGEGSDAYFRHYLKTERFIQILTKNLEGLRDGKMISYKQFSELRLPTPSSPEQQKIADCLSSLDELIAAQARKVDALKIHKKGLMQQLFPREGETQPRLRFPEFQNADEWEETRLEKLGNLIAGLTYSPDDVRESGLLVLRSSNVQNSEIALDDCVYVDPSIKGANLSQPEDILICVRNGSKALIGKCALIPQGMPLCTHGAFMTVFRADTPSFVFQLFQSDRYQKQVAGDLGATINSINGSQFLKYEFFVPKPAEQKRIADFLASLDTLITASTQELETLKTHKKGLMQQLFPSAEAVAA
ncbi:restriction endonuclease subunit S [Ottowia oryzae]